MPIQQMLLGAGAAKDRTYIDDLFSTALRTGDGGNKTIENDLDLSNEGGIVWVKERNDGNSHTLFATDMPDISSKRPYLNTNSSNVRATKSNIDIAFYSNGYQIQGNDGQINQASGNTYVDWSMRKAPGFFDVVTYSGNSTARTIAHSLGCVPGSIWVKSLTESQSWSVYHRKSNASPEDYKLRLDDTHAAFTWNPAWNSTLPTSTHFSLGTHGSINGSGHDYIALIFAHDEQIFGGSGNASVIKCDSWTGSGSAGLEVNVGFEPQWVLFKNASATYNWYILDVTRGIVSSGDDEIISNTSDGAWDSSYIDVTPTGFKLQTSHALGNASGNTYVYIAIRRPDGYVGKPADAGTDVFTMDTGSSSSGIPTYDSGFPVDFAFTRRPAATDPWYTSARLLHGKYLHLHNSDTIGTSDNFIFDSTSGWAKDHSSDYQSWMWKRHAGFDVVTYKGNATAGHTISHSMNAVPEMMWIKNRDQSENWTVYHKNLNGGSSPEDYYMYLNSSGAEGNHSFWNSYAPTSTQFKVSANDQVNGNNHEILALLFASVSGISKVGTYTGNATDSDPTSGTNTITFGFQPRMVIIKSYDAANTSWHILDTLRGWTTGDSTKRLRLNLTNAQSTEPYGYPTSTGMVLTGNGDGHLNNSGDNYIYYAHA